MNMRTVIATACLALISCGVVPATAQSLLDRTPNMSAGWTGDAGSAYFHFLHRFNQQGAPERRVLNRPTFLLATTVSSGVLLGVHYATRSDVVARVPNEWETFARFAAVRGSAALPVDVTLQAGYNAAARSVDGEVGLAAARGRLRVLGAARVLSAAYGGDTRVVAAGGVALRVTRRLAINADIARLLDGHERAAWGIGVHGAIPASPHSFSVQATNTNSATLQGASWGANQVRWGFEFTVPITLARYFGGDPSVDAVPSAPDGPGAANDHVAGDSVIASIRGMAFVPARIEVEPGTVVIWQNGDEVVHTVTAADGGFDSLAIAPGSSWRHVFREPGEYPYYCGPHPFMRGTVVVRRP